MIDLETIEREISELEARQPSYKVCERLSWLYTVCDHLKAKVYPPEGRAELMASTGGSDFLDAVDGKPYKDVLKVVDEHLETIRLLYPKTYDSVLARIRELC